MKNKMTGLEWLKAQVAYAGDDCLKWPLSGVRGYGNVAVRIGGALKLKKAHRVMCELAHGKPPTPKHEAAHSCGNGSKGCVNPRHVSWKTRAENAADAVRHGTHYAPRGAGTRRKLDREKVRQIRALQGRLSQDKIAAQFGVTHSTIAKIHRGELWP